MLDNSVVEIWVMVIDVLLSMWGKYRIIGYLDPLGFGIQRFTAQVLGAFGLCVFAKKPFDIPKPHT